jgi:hypothetical protein
VKLKAVHTCPVWEEPDGTRRPGFEEEPDHPPVVGWCNVLDIELGGERYRLLAVYTEDDDAP